MKNRILSLLLIIILIFTNSISLANDYNSKQNLNVNETTIIGESIITVLEDNSNKYVVEEIEGNLITLTTNDKINNNLIIQKWDETDKNGTFSEEIINISEYIEKVDQQNNDISTYAMTVGSQNTSKGGYSYKYYSYDKRSYNWEVKTPKTSYYNFPEAHRKQSDINGFKSAVDSIVCSERLGGAAVGVSLMTAGVNLLYASGVGAALALVGGVGAAATAIISIDSHSKDANYYNTRLRNNS